MDIRSSILLTDLYQLTMLQSYMEQGMDETSVFEFFVRKMPSQRGFFMAAGLEQLEEFLEFVHFTPWELDWIEKSGLFSKSFVDYLEHLGFRGDLHAMAEGTVFFPNEPIARITAPLPQAQLVETRLINLLQFQTLVASKAKSVLEIINDTKKACMKEARKTNYFNEWEPSNQLESENCKGGEDYSEFDAVIEQAEVE